MSRHLDSFLNNKNIVFVKNERNKIVVNAIMLMALTDRETEFGNKVKLPFDSVYITLFTPQFCP